MKEINWKKIDWSKPYILKYSARGKSLIFFGSIHTFNSKHPQFKELQKLFKNFKPEIVLVEGGISPEKFASKEEATKKEGERGLIQYLCEKFDTPIISCEPKLKSLANKLARKYSKEEVFLSLIIREILCFSMKRENVGVEDFLSYVVKNMKKEIGWKNFDFSLKNLDKIHKKFFNRKLNPLDIKFYRKISYPIYNNSIFNEISREESRIRDKHVFNLIKRMLRKYSRVFVVMGSSHAIALEKELKSFMAKK